MRLRRHRPAIEPLSVDERIDDLTRRAAAENDRAWRARLVEEGAVLCSECGGSGYVVDEVGASGRARQLPERVPCRACGASGRQR